MLKWFKVWLSTTALWASVVIVPVVGAESNPNFRPETTDSFKWTEFDFVGYFTQCKFRLDKDYRYTLSFDTGVNLECGKIVLHGKRLLLKAGYGWDGASGPVIDTENVLRGSAIHDALYALMREGYLEEDEFRSDCDRELARILKEDGVQGVRRAFIYGGVQMAEIDETVNGIRPETGTITLKKRIKVSLQSVALVVKTAIRGERLLELGERSRRVRFEPLETSG